MLKRSSILMRYTMFVCTVQEPLLHILAFLARHHISYKLCLCPPCFHYCRIVDSAKPRTIKLLLFALSQMLLHQIQPPKKNCLQILMIHRQVIASISLKSPSVLIPYHLRDINEALQTYLLFPSSFSGEVATSQHISYVSSL